MAWKYNSEEQQKALAEEKKKWENLRKAREIVSDRISDMRMYLQAADFMSQSEKEDDYFYSAMESRIGSDNFLTLMKMIREAIDKVEKEAGNDV